MDGANIRTDRIGLAQFVAATLVGVLTLGCEPPASSNHYTLVTGWVVSCRPETGELTVRTRDDLSRRSKSAEQTLNCIITKDSEIYINDAFSEIEDIQIGDPVELVGYHDPNPRHERFHVLSASFEHAMPAAPIPVLSIPASQPLPED